MIIVTVYRTSACHLCDEVQDILEDLRPNFDLQVVIVNVDDNENEGLRSLIGETYPIVEIGPYRLRPPINRQSLEVVLGAARDRQSQLQQFGEKDERNQRDRQTRWSAADALSLWLSRHYLAVFNFFLLLYVGIPFLAPLSLRLGWSW
ncbi:MAG: glutaredoxin family protein [Thermanaerothrix sp.]|nr:glutaredoxin family protein [Thermanaerothrix sp.]